MSDLHSYAGATITHPDLPGRAFYRDAAGEVREYPPDYAKALLGNIAASIAPAAGGAAAE